MAPTAAGLCWWCQSEPATSAEHAIQKADFVQRFGTRIAPQNQPVIVSIEPSSDRIRSMRIQGPKSRALKFSASLCHHCNTTKSQPYDRAYQTFSNFLFRHWRTIGQRGFIDFQRIYRAAAPSQLPLLLGYFAKKLGCALIDANPEHGVPELLRRLIGVGDTKGNFGITVSYWRDGAKQLGPMALGPPELHPIDPSGAAVMVLVAMPFIVRVWWLAIPAARSGAGELVSRYRPCVRLGREPPDGQITIKCLMKIPNRHG